jgi:predicted DNA-binding protein
MGNKVLRSIYLDIAQVERIKKLSEITKVPQAVYVREGLDLLLEKYESKIDSPSHKLVAEEQA